MAMHKKHCCSKSALQTLLVHLIIKNPLGKKKNHKGSLDPQSRKKSLAVKNFSCQTNMSAKVGKEVNLNCIEYTSWTKALSLK